MDNISSPKVSFRTMLHDDIEAGLRLSRASGWNQTRRDWELFLRLSPRGCRVAVKDGQIIGTVATVRYENRFCWIGMVLVDPAERGQGVGKQLMSEALRMVDDMSSIRLDATPAGHKLYRQLGFVDEYRLSRMETVVSDEHSMLLDNPSRPMTNQDLPAVVKFDRDVFGADRRATLEWMFDGAPEYAWVFEQGGQIAGYTFGRHGLNFEHLGPVIAHDQKAARQLVLACLHGRAGKRFVTDAAQHEPGWRSWLESIGFSEQRPLIRMFYRDNPFPGQPSKQFSILGPEFG